MENLEPSAIIACVGSLYRSTLSDKDKAVYLSTLRLAYQNSHGAVSFILALAREEKLTEEDIEHVLELADFAE